MPDNWTRFSKFVTDGTFFSFAWRLFILLLLLAAIIGLGYMFFHGQITVESVRDGEFMRGVITMLMLVTVLVLVIVLVLASLFSDDDVQAGKRIALGREVMAPLFGILGTIVGFYFGLQAGDAKSKSATPTAPVEYSMPNPSSDEGAFAAPPETSSSKPGAELLRRPTILSE